MRARRRIIAVVAGAAVAAAAPVAMAPSSNAAISAVAVACASTVWTEGPTYTTGQQVTYQGHNYSARQAHTAHPGAGWNPAATPTLWRDDGVCTGGGTPTTPPTTRPPTTPPTTAPPTTRPPTTPPTTNPPTTSPPGNSICAVKSRPAGKVLQGYWETWDGAINGVHPGFGWVPINDPRIIQHGYNVLMAAFPVIRPDGTVLWEDGMDATVKVGTPAQVCSAKAAGATVLMSIGGATAAVDLSSTTVVNRFVSTIVPILKRYNFDGIDIDIESGLTGSGNINALSTSQANLIRLIDGVLGQMPSNFGLTMAPETAYVTGGSVTYGSIWGAYLPVIKKYLDNGRLWWLNMQYYNGSMYGCRGDSYNAATVQGFTVQTDCLKNGLSIPPPPAAAAFTLTIPYDKQVPGLPAQVGAGGGYMSPALVSQAYNPALKGLMTWSINWDGARGWTFGDNVKRLQGR